MQVIALLEADPVLAGDRPGMPADRSVDDVLHLRLVVARRLGARDDR
jgi:hypothetical protein